MGVSGKIVVMAFCAALAGCGHREAADANKSAAAVTSEALTPPANPDDATAWRAFIGKAIAEETHDATAHPYAFIVPAGDSAQAQDTRKTMASAIRTSLGNTAVPENMFALTGPDSSKVAEVIVMAFQDLPARTGQGLTVLYVGVPAAASKAQEAVHASGAQLRLRAMRG